jgi:hypothetical protein
MLARCMNSLIWKARLQLWICVLVTRTVIVFNSLSTSKQLLGCLFSTLSV